MFHKNILFLVIGTLAIKPTFIPYLEALIFYMNIIVFFLRVNPNLIYYFSCWTHSKHLR